MIKIFQFLRKIKRIFGEFKEIFLTLRNRRLIKKYKISFIKPNYLFLSVFKPGDIVIDVGCGFDADLSVALIKKYGVKSFGVDPTKKHQERLKQLELQHRGNFFHLPVAISSENGEVEFFESENNVSGSFFLEHKNIASDRVISYNVKSLTPDALLKEIGLKKAEYLKLDLEGAEYDLIFSDKKEFFEPFSQVFVEFHHGTVSQYSKKHTKKAVGIFENNGFLSFTIDDISYLFFTPKEVL